MNEEYQARQTDAEQKWDSAALERGLMKAFAELFSKSSPPEAPVSSPEASPFAFLAPMAGYTDAPFRALCREFYPVYAVTEMVSAAAIHYKDKKTAELARLADGDAPTAVQIFGHDAAFIAEAAQRLASGELCGARPAAIDINMGCPVKKIVSGGDGSALMRDPSLCASLVEAAVRAAEPFGVPVTVKIRLGFDREHINAPEVARAVAAAGASAICVHGRTREQMYSGEASLDGVARVREAVDPAIPVFGNGDVTCREDAKRMIAYCGVDGVAVGRAALAAPWVFAAIADETFVPPDEDERKRIALRLVRSVCETHGERAGVVACRARLGFLLAGMRDAASMRRELNEAATLAEVERAMRTR